MAELKIVKSLAGYHLIDHKNNTENPSRIKYIAPWK
jgi:hypothetical protein